MKINKKWLYVGLIGVVILLAWQIYLYRLTKLQLEGTVEFTEYCIKENKCGGLRPTNSRLENWLSQLMPPLSNQIRSSTAYKHLQTILPQAKQGIEKADQEFERLKQEDEQVLNSIDEVLEKHSARHRAEEQRIIGEYRELGPPKILYKCDESIGYIAGRGIHNYNDIFIEAKNSCGSKVSFEILKDER